jgi:putative transposase
MAKMVFRHPRIFVGSCLKVCGSMMEGKTGLATYFMFYNERRRHQNFDRKTPAVVYFSSQPQKQAAV